MHASDTRGTLALVATTVGHTGAIMTAGEALAEVITVLTYVAWETLETQSHSRQVLLLLK